MAVVSGGTTLIDNGALDAGVPTGSLILLSTQTASASASLEFSMDSTYDSYVFKFINCHPATDQVGFQFNMSTDSGSNYNVTKTSTLFIGYQNEPGTASGLIYNAANDLAQSTSFQNLIFPTLSNDNDSNVSGQLILYNPSSTTFVKHFISISNATVEEVSGTDPYSENFFVAGYGNTTSPVTNLKFQMSSGNIDDGIIKMYGVK